MLKLQNKSAEFMNAVKLFLLTALIFLSIACQYPTIEQKNSVTTQSNIEPKSVAIADSFAYPVGKTDVVTQKKDKDEWYNALDFGENDHLGEDWNKNTGGNTDCGEAVYAAANGIITYAGDAGPGWGNVVIIEHTLPSGEKIESLYGHMLEILKRDGGVKKREQIGKVGNANGRYLCHLHFEMRTKISPVVVTQANEKDGLILLIL
ncbi:MAG: M23 family metallopeptidase [Chloracidobacterium sp.]|nr:M23 family metallopeptidase [Chloracidobacterium sp.]